MIIDKSDISVIIGAALIGLGVILAVGLQRIGILVLVPGVARRCAQLLHLVPCRRALAADGVVGAGRLCALDALLHLLRNLVRRRRHGAEVVDPSGGAWPLPRAAQL